MVEGEEPVCLSARLFLTDLRHMMGCRGRGGGSPPPLPFLPLSSSSAPPAPTNPSPSFRVPEFNIGERGREERRSWWPDSIFRSSPPLTGYY